MCTRHLAENYQRLAAAIAKESFPRGEVALEYLALAEAALEYAGGPPQELQRASGRLARRSAALIYERHPEWEQKWGPSGREKCVDDGLYHLSFLADALAGPRAQAQAESDEHDRNAPGGSHWPCAPGNEASCRALASRSPTRKSVAQASR